MAEAGTAVVVPTNLAPLQKRSSAMVEAAKLIKVTSEASLEEATQFMRGVKTVEREIKAEMKKIKDPLNLGLKNARALENKMLATPAAAEAIVDPRIGAFRKKKREDQAERDAEKLAEAEAQAEKDKAAQIKALEKKGDADSLEKAEEIRAAPAVMPAMGPAKRAVKKQDGASGKMDWKFRVVDENKLIQACSANSSLRKYIKPDLVEIGKTVKVLKADTNIPGVSAYSEESRTYKSLEG